VLICNKLDGAFDLIIHATPLKWEKIHEVNLIQHAGKICLFIYQKSSNKCDKILIRVSDAYVPDVVEQFPAPALK
jgi:hypothetical protein